MLLKNKKYGYPDMVILPFRVSPFYSTVFALRRIISALLPTFSIYVSARFINTAKAILEKTAEINQIYIPILLLALFMIYNVLIGNLMSFFNCRATILYRKKLRPEVIGKRARLDYKHIENQKSYDLINRVCPRFETTIRDMYNRVLDIVENVVYVAGIVIALLTQVWWVGLFILISAVPVSIIAARAGRRSYEADREMSKVDRRANYISNVLKSREAFEERGIYGYSDKMNELYAERYEYARKFRQKVIRRNFVRTKMGGVITSLLSIITMLAMLQPVAQGRLNLGMFIGLMGAVFGLSNRLSWGVNWLIEELVKKREFLKDLTEFMSLEEIPGANDLPREGMNFKTIKFRNVSFKYPGTDKPVLDNVSFAIENGRHYSFVGENGAGKTTITKLITGLYTNYEGEILVDNRPLRELSQSEIKGLSSVVYQDFAKYSVSMYDNIAVARLSNNSNIEQSDSGQIDNGQIDRDQFATGQIGNGQIDSNQGDRDQTDSSQIDSSQIDGNRSSRADVLYAANLVGLAPTIEKLPDGIDTPLGKVHEKGMDISGGEWQRVALARGVLSPAPLRILDEPTASLDPISESRIYSMFERISMGMTTIFISHRLGSTKLADTIYVLKDGKIVECGSHNELMERHGVYYEMFQAQAEWYAGNGSIKDMNETEVYANA